jgi:hypothetical protein
MEMNVKNGDIPARVGEITVRKSERQRRIFCVSKQAKSSTRGFGCSGMTLNGHGGMPPVSLEAATLRWGLDSSAFHACQRS